MSKSKLKTLPNLKIFILAGEASGDQIGADLIEKLGQQVSLDMSGVGGANMRDQGMKSLFPITDLSVMGHVDVILRLPLLLWRVRQTIRYIIATNPQIVVLIDSQVFSNLVAKGLKKRGYPGPILLYVGPTVWGYKPERAKHIVPLYDEVLTILPFEPAILKALHGPPSQYVGHPVLARKLSARPIDQAKSILLLPGSRVGEIRRHLGIIKDIAHQLHQDFPDLCFFMLTLPHLVSRLQKQTKSWKMNVEITAEKSRRQEIFSTSDIAITVAGTATLELAIAKIPMVAIYVMDAVQVRVNKSVQVKYISLPNYILDTPLVFDHLLEKPDSAPIIASAQDLLNNPSSRQKQIDGFLTLEKAMEQGTPDFPRRNPAHCVLAHVQLNELK